MAAALAEKPWEPSETQKGSQTMASRKILLVDDSETVLQMEQMILEPNSYELITARDGEEGIAKALQSKPDLILMDVVMPKMDGFEAVKRLREHQQMRAVPVVMVTSKAEAESMEAGYQSGCNDYIIKPIDRFELLTKVKNLLGE
ncbi:MAG TPA: response regulator [Candidatus Binatia bacterium]